MLAGHSYGGMVTRRAGPASRRVPAVAEDPAWEAYALDGGHNLMGDAPEAVVKILLDAA